MTTGTAATADDAYLLRSIVEPGKEIVAGYAAVMPSYRGQLSDSQLSALVQEVKELPAERTPTPTATTVLAVDPVCHMTVRAEAGTLHEHYQGRDIYFCSETCRASFLANPGKFSSSGK
jgi:YHS domain-containing protein